MPPKKNAGGVLYPKRIETPAGKFSWYEAVVKNIPPLKHARGSRWPLIAWENFSTEPQKPEFYQALLARGLAEHIRLEPKQIDTALAIQRAGSPVIVLEGAGGPFPASLAGDPSLWAHQFDAGYKPKGEVRPCPSLHAGWAIFAERLRETLRHFKQKGVVIDAVWNDWENDPLYGPDRYEQARHCKRCREILPAKTLDSERHFTDYTVRVFYDLFGAYYAAPVLEFYPQVLGHQLARPAVDAREPAARLEQRTGPRPNAPVGHRLEPDRLRGRVVDLEGAKQVRKARPGARRPGLHQRPLAAGLAHLETHPPLGSGKRIDPLGLPLGLRAAGARIPVMSRERYREVLRHLWLRGVAAMQVFAPRMKSYEDMALPEIEDAVAIYDEMLAFREFLDKGEILTYDVPHEQDDGVVWSGLRLGNRAVVRVFKQGGGKAKQTLRPWGQKSFDLEADGTGRTYLLDREGIAKKV